MSRRENNTAGDGNCSSNGRATKHPMQDETLSQSEESHHAHFDCFSGAAGDMMLAACLDAAGDNCQYFLSRAKRCIEQGIPQLKDEFDISIQTVKRGQGRISAKYVTVKSVYDHQPAPVPGEVVGESTAAAGGHDHSHTHHHGHSHSHNNYTHGNSHSDSSIQTQNGSHSHTHEHLLRGPLRNLDQIRDMLTNAGEQWIPRAVRDQAIQVFTRLAQAEATVHGANNIESVHFHEVGAIDSIVDVVATLLVLHFLGVKTVSHSPLPLGEGSVWTDHGLLPVPAPATLNLMIGMPIVRGPPGVTGELVTPTGVALLRVLNESSSTQPPSFTIRKVGVGAGTKNFDKHPNILRVMIGDVTTHDHVAPQEGD